MGVPDFPMNVPDFTVGKWSFDRCPGVPLRDFRNCRISRDFVGCPGFPHWLTKPRPVKGEGWGEGYTRL